MNVELLERIVAHVVENPARLVMGDFFVRKEPGSRIQDNNFIFSMPACGTVGCLAGWANHFTQGQEVELPEGIHRLDQWARAGVVLDLTNAQCRKLFLTDSWPTPFAQEWEEASLDFIKEALTRRAQVFKARVEKFIETNGEM